MAKLIGDKPNQVPTNADLGTLAYQDKDNVNIGGGVVDGVTIDNAVIGGSTPAAGTFTTLTTGSMSTTGDITFGDNDKAIFGAGSDLQIYHSGTESIIQDSGTGNLRIQAANLELNSWDNAETYIQCVDNGAVTLYHNNSAKLATTSTGIDVTGTVVADGLTVNKGSDGNNIVSLTGAATNRFLNIQSFTNLSIPGAGYDFNATSGQGAIRLSTENTARLKVENNGDISFYEDTGTTPKLFWDASAESLGIGTSSPTARLNIQGGYGAQLTLQNTATNSTNKGGTLTGAHFNTAEEPVLIAASFSTTNTNDVYVGGGWSDANATMTIRFHTAGNTTTTGGGTERMRIDSSGDVHIGITSQVTAGTTGISFDSDIAVIRLGRAGTGTATKIAFFNDNGEVGSIKTIGSSTSYNTSSDYRLKENVVDMTGAIDRVKALPVRRFNFITDPDKTVDGFLAHEAQEIVPEAVTGEKDAVDKDGNPEHQGIDQAKLVPLLTGAIKELIAEVETLKAEIQTLKGA